MMVSVWKVALYLPKESSSPAKLKLPFFMAELKLFIVASIYPKYIFNGVYSFESPELIGSSMAGVLDNCRFVLDNFLRDV